jgi:hypothetical protein
MDPQNQQPQYPQPQTQSQPVPQQPAALPQYQQQAPVNNYDFLNATPAKRRPMVFGGGNKTIVSVLFVLGVLFLLTILFVVFQSLTKKDYSAYIKLTQKQAEIVRVSDLGAAKARSTSTKNYVQTIRTVTASEQVNTLAFLSKKGQKVGTKQLVLLKDSSTDKKLAAAEQTSAYDDTLLNTLNGLILDYQKSIKTTTGAPIGTSETTLANTLKNNAKAIVNSK